MALTVTSRVIQGNETVAYMIDMNELGNKVYSVNDAIYMVRSDPTSNAVVVNGNFIRLKPGRGNLKEISVAELPFAKPQSNTPAVLNAPQITRVPIGNGLEYDQQLSLGGSAGRLPKWLLYDEKSAIYAKGRSQIYTFEPEVEVCAYNLAVLFGVPAVEYRLMTIPYLSKKPVSVSRDFKNGCKCISLYSYVHRRTNQDAATYKGADKLALVESVLPDEARVLHRQTLIFDYIVGNSDRHLRNFDVRLNADGSFNSLVPVFDMGDSLFSSTLTYMLLFTRNAVENRVASLPYVSPHMLQIRLLGSRGVVQGDLLKSVQKSDIQQTIHKYFPGIRGKLITDYVVRNTARLGLLIES